MSNTTAKNLLLSHRTVESVSVPPLAYTVENGYSSTLIRVEVPGIDPATIDVSCSDNKLFVSCDRGDIAFPLDATTDFSKVSADIQWGMLTIEIPSPAEPETRSIRVNIHDAAKAASNKASTKFTKED